MIGKVITGKSFGGCVRYVVQKQDAETLYAEGVRAQQVDQTIRDFNMQRKANPDLGKAVGHIALSWSSYDHSKLSDPVMVEVAREYLEKMKILDTQFLIVKHQDRNHPHLHIIYNRVDNKGKTVTDAFQHKRNTNVCRDLTKKYGFFLAEGKSQVNRQQLKGEDKVKYELFDKIKSASRQAHSLDQLKVALANQGIEMLYKYKGTSAEIQGVSFKKGEYTFKGSEIDRSLSYGNLMKALEESSQQQDIEPPSLAQQLRQVIAEQRAANSQNTSSQGAGLTTGSFLNDVASIGTSLFQELFTAVPQQPEPEMPRKKKKKHHSQDQSQGMKR